MQEGPCVPLDDSSCDGSLQLACTFNARQTTGRRENVEKGGEKLVTEGAVELALIYLNFPSYGHTAH